MPVDHACAQCGKPIPLDAPQAACPECLLLLALPGKTLSGVEMENSTSGLSSPRAVSASAETVVYTGELPQLNDYELLAKIGEGGMGIVYKARHLRSDRIEALKLMKKGLEFDQDNRRRFEGEARILAQIGGPHIVQVYHVGEENGRSYFSMEYIDGGNLDQHLKSGPLEPKEAARLIETLARAVECAHQAGILHRDLKPSNVLLAKGGQDTRIGQLSPRLSDFGLAKQLEEAEGHTLSGAVLGTPGYMSPEQAEGLSKSVDFRTDVYGLGAILYECLTGDPPFRGPTKSATRRLVLTEEPVPPSKKRREVPAILEAICLHCLEKDPARRYATAAELADDLGCWQRGESTKIRPPRWPVKLWRAVWRRRSFLRAVALVLATVLVTAAVVYCLLPPTPGQNPPQGKADPDAELRAIDYELAAGREVTLIGETGPPRWLRWKDVKGAVRDSAEVFSFQTIGACFVELLPDPRVERYELSAEIRHDRNPQDKPSYVGVYVGFQAKEVNGQRVVKYFLLMFQEDTVGGPPHVVHFEARCEPANRPPLGVQRGRLEFDPVTDLSNRPWRKVAIVVEPNAIRAFCDHKKPGEMQQFVDLNEAKLKTITNLMRGQYGDLIQDDFQPRLELGLYANNGIVSFRNVRIKPLRP